MLIMLMYQALRVGGLIALAWEQNCRFSRKSVVKLSSKPVFR